MSVVLAGQTAPGTGGGTYTGFDYALLNDSGDVVFSADVTGGTASFVLLLLLGSIIVPPLPLVVSVAAGGAVAAGVAALTGRASKKKHEEVLQELEGVLDSLERGDDLAPPPASWRRWVKRQAKRFRVDLLGEIDS